MRQLERLLLYFVAFGLAAMLIADGLSTSRVDRLAPPVLHRREIETSKSVPAEIRPVAKEPQAESETRRTNGGANSRSVQVADSTGRVRIELSLNDSDQPQLILRRSDGEVVTLLSTDDEGGAKLTLGSFRGSTQIICDRDGSQSIELRSGRGQSVSMSSRGDGSCDIRLRGSEDKMELSLRRANDSEAELRMRPAGAAAGGVSLAAKADGAVSMRLTAKDGITGPVLSVLEDKTAQVAVNGASNQSGPSLIRTPEGVSIVSARLPNGNPGASMVTSPDGRSVIAVSDERGRRSAELRIDEHGVPTVQAHDPDAKPPRMRPKPTEEMRKTDGEALYSAPAP